MNRKPLFIAADLYGCPNRCLHCWLGHMENRPMEKGADEWIVSRFRPYFDKITFFSWLREPDFGPDYREQWDRDRRLSAGALPPRFELASFWRLVRDPDYAPFLKEAGVACVQLTFFGLEETTDRYVGRKGAFRELLKATEILLEHEISPRWQAFINEENREEIPLCSTFCHKSDINRNRFAAKTGKIKEFMTCSWVLPVFVWHFVWQPIGGTSIKTDQKQGTGDRYFFVLFLFFPK